jgi:aspartate-semialdehyde dehydrogenase
MSDGFNIAVVGATGAVGELIIELLEQRNFPIKHIFPVASAYSAGKVILIKGKPVTILDIAEFDFSQIQLAFFSAGKAVSAQYVPHAEAAGCLIIDNTSQFRYEQDIPLVIPEVNPQTINLQSRRIIANPNCSTIQMLVALKPLHDAAKITRIDVATYQAVSGLGKRAVSELAKQTGELLNGLPATVEVFPQQIAFNAIPQVDQFEDNGYTREEMKMVWETKKILGDSIEINPTAVRIPVLYGHSAVISIETQNQLSREQAIALLTQAPGVAVKDDPRNGLYPTPFMDGANQDQVWVGRIRADLTRPNGLNLWVVADNVRKGGALNSVQIAELLIDQLSKSPGECIAG